MTCNSGRLLVVGWRKARRRKQFCAEVAELEGRRLLSMDVTAPVTAVSVTGAAQVGGDSSLTYQADGGSTVQVQFSATDPDDASSTLTTEYSTDNGQTFTKNTSLSISGDGTHQVEFFSVDPAGNVEALRTLTVNIGNAQNGSLTVTANPNSLWPPNHKPVTVTVSGTVSGLNGATTVSYNVLDEYHPGSPIITGTAPVNSDGTYSFQVNLTASRNGQDHNGRTYTINVMTTGDSGSLANSTTVIVPHDQGGGGGGDQETTDRDFVDGAFQTLLGRQADQGGEDYFVNQMRSGMTPGQVVNILEHTPEYETKEINQLYEQVLGRAADPAGLQTFQGWLNAGATPRMIEQALLDSAEFNAKYPSNDAFINAAYQAILGRAPDASGQAYFTGLLNAGVSRDVIVSDLLYSSEMDEDIIATAYARVLDRDADAPGNEHFMNALKHGWGNRLTVYLDLMASPEYIAAVTGTSGNDQG